MLAIINYRIHRRIRHHALVDLRDVGDGLFLHRRGQLHRWFGWQLQQSGIGDDNHRGPGRGRYAVVVQLFRERRHGRDVGHRGDRLLRCLHQPATFAMT